MSFTAIETRDIRATITEAYLPGGDHIDRWLNVAGSGVQNCIDDQVKALEADPSIVFYRVENDGKFAGYFGRNGDGSQLHTILIVPTFRPRKLDFFKLVKSEMKPVFYVGGYVKNVPACEFYRKMGGKQVDTVSTDFGPGILFKFSNQKAVG